jgi:hypothetical protein
LGGGGVVELGGGGELDGGEGGGVAAVESGRAVPQRAQNRLAVAVSYPQFAHVCIRGAA